MARCGGCGAVVKAGSKSCEYCGSPVSLSELESVLDFYETRETRIADEKMREAEASRAAEVANATRVLKLILPMLLVMALVVGWGISAEHRAERNTVAMPQASSEFKGRDYRDVKTDLQAAGFTSVEAIAVPDLTTGWWKEPDEVKEVSINGRTDFSADDRFPPDARIVIRYHAFPEDE